MIIVVFCLNFSNMYITFAIYWDDTYPYTLWLIVYVLGDHENKNFKLYCFWLEVIDTSFSVYKLRDQKLE